MNLNKSKNVISLIVLVITMIALYYETLKTSKIDIFPTKSIIEKIN